MSFADRDEAEAFLTRYPEVKLIELYLIDLNGVPRGKWLRREELPALYDTGRAVPHSLLATDIHGVDVPGTGLLWETGDADGWIRPLAGSLQPMPWHPAPAAQVQATFDPASPPGAAAEPRRVLETIERRLRDEGHHPVMAAELEFYLLAAGRGPRGRPRPAAPPGGETPHAAQVYGLEPLAAFAGFFNDLYRACETLQLPARTAISEAAPGQFEITLQHQCGAVAAIDEAIRYKRLVKGLAMRHGMRASFMAKPFAGLPGNGLHLHISLADDAGTNLFAGPAPEGSERLRHGIGGLLATMSESLALLCPHANSYRRFQAHSYAPLAPAWGVNNRTVPLRIPAGPPASRHLEHRIAGADANLYLAAAALLAGLHHGIHRQLDPGAPVTGDGYATDRPQLTTIWHQALADFAASDWAAEYFNPTFRRAYSTIKAHEQSQFHAEVGEQDWRWYLDVV